MAGSGHKDGAGTLAERIAQALLGAEFDPQHGSDLFLRADAERAIKAALPGARIAVAGKDGAAVRPAHFMGARFAPDLVVELAGSRPAAVTLTLLRGDAGPVPVALANALVLSARYGAVVAFFLDRRLAKRDPFAMDEEPAEPRGLSEAEQGFVQQLWRDHRVKVEIRRQDPFGWG